MQEKTYYNQNSLIDFIHQKTGYAKDQVYEILNALSTVIAEKTSETINETEIKICTGIKVSSKFLKSGEYHSNLHKDGVIAPTDKVITKVKLSKAYKQTINDLHRTKVGGKEE